MDDTNPSLPESPVEEAADLNPRPNNVELPDPVPMLIRLVLEPMPIQNVEEFADPAEIELMRRLVPLQAADREFYRGQVQAAHDETYQTRGELLRVSRQLYNELGLMGRQLEAVRLELEEARATIPPEILERILEEEEQQNEAVEELFEITEQLVQNNDRLLLDVQRLQNRDAPPSKRVEAGVYFHRSSLRSSLGIESDLTSPTFKLMFRLQSSDNWADRQPGVFCKAKYRTSIGTLSAEWGGSEKYSYREVELLSKQGFSVGQLKSSVLGRSEKDVTNYYLTTNSCQNLGSLVGIESQIRLPIFSNIKKLKKQSNDAVRAKDNRYHSSMMNSSRISAPVLEKNIQIPREKKVFFGVQPLPSRSSMVLTQNISYSLLLAVGLVILGASFGCFFQGNLFRGKWQRLKGKLKGLKDRLKRFKK